ncbi:hypothetical protein CRENBAI_007104 [Crenichthys baileyi]|uniref:Uncharacterized protein n=1 Tax=Crenichthys baileyi TaxID=28760 RepID=A0AAV9RS55_9TELE
MMNLHEHLRVHHLAEYAMLSLAYSRPTEPGAPGKQPPGVSRHTPKHPAPDTKNQQYASGQRHQPHGRECGREEVQVPIPQRGNQPPDPGGGPLYSSVDTGKPPKHQPRLVLALPEPEQPWHRPRPQPPMTPVPIWREGNEQKRNLPDPNDSAPGQSSPNPPVNPNLNPMSSPPTP